MKQPAWNQVTAIFGGTFDPPHLGHREAVSDLFTIVGIQRVIVMPAAIPPHKSSPSRPENRIEMARLNFSEMPVDVSIDDREILRAERTGRPSYTFETLSELRPEIPDLAFVIGTDQFQSMAATWWRFPEILRLSHWLVLERRSSGNSSDRQALTRTLADWQASNLIVKTGVGTAEDARTWKIQGSDRFLRLVPTEARAVSSSEIRAAIARTGEPVVDSLHPEVLAYLKQSRLYGI